MNLKRTSTKVLMRSSALGALLCLVVSLPLEFFPRLGEPWFNISYDFIYLFQPSKPIPDEVRILYVDEATYTAVGQEPKEFDRGHYAPVIDRLIRDGARLVMIDVWMDPNKKTAGDQALAEAIRRSNGRVVLVTETDSSAHREVPATTARPPELFLAAGAHAGPSVPIHDASRSIVRQYDHGTRELPGFAWLGAQIAGAARTRDDAAPDEHVYLNYYGPAKTLLNYSFAEVLKGQPEGLFKDRHVFIGSLPKLQYAQELSDKFRTPHARWGSGSIAGVEIAATAFLNLMRGDGLYRVSPGVELLLVTFTGIILGGGLVWLRPWWAAAAAVLLGVSLSVFACVQVWQTHVWFNWALIVSVQAPMGLLWSVVAHTRWLSREKQELEQTLTRTLLEVEQTRDHARELAKASAAATPGSQGSLGGQASPTPAIPDHTLVKCVGKGGYGEVWLAKNAVGIHHVVKLVYRASFSDSGPYEREFRGIQRFMPISRSHPGFVHILHVGRNDTLGFFFYIMETGDDEVRGQDFDPATYEPKNLGNWIRRSGALEVKECVAMGIAMTATLEKLHEKGLIHRDIKPANIIYVDGHPKLADIGLVTEMETTNADVSRLGTDGYMAPEGPGSASSDLYSLGKVLYEACMGLDRRRFPELPTALYDSVDSVAKLRLNRIIIRACEPRPEDRYATAPEMRKDLQELMADIEAG